jgi:hypothetical protein
MFAVIIIAGLTAVNQFLSLLSDWNTSRKDNPLGFWEFLKSEQIKSYSFVVAIALILISGVISYASDQANVKLIGDVDATELKVDTVRVLADSIQDLQRELSTQQRNLVAAYQEIDKLQKERYNQIVGGDSPPTLKLVTRMYPSGLAHWDKKTQRFINDSSMFHVVFTFIFINESPYIIKSARVTVDNLDYLNQYRFLQGTYKKDPGTMGIMKFNNSHEVHEFNTMPPDKEGLRSKAFSIMVPREGYDLFQFHLSVEWSNGFYTADIEVTPSQDFDESKYFKIGPEYARQHRCRVTKVSFLPLPGRKAPRFVFVPEPKTFVPWGELRNE